VDVEQGFVCLFHADDGAKVWRTYCRSVVCLPRAAAAKVTAVRDRRLTADGLAYFPYDVAALPIIRRAPGAFFNRELKVWAVSLAPKDRELVLEIARILKLEVAPELLVLDAGETDTVAEAAHLSLVAARIGHAKSVGAYTYQLAGVKFIIDNPRCLLGDDMGLGKSLMSLCAIPPDHGAIIVVPASVKYNWAKECRRWRPELRPRVLSAAAAAVDVLPRFPGEVVILNYDILPDIDGACPTFPLMIISDEAHAFKNTRTKRHKTMKAWGRLADRFVIMTGTPMTNRPPDLWGTLEVAGLAVKAFDSMKNFRRLFGMPERGGSWEGCYPSDQVPAMLRQVMLRRTQEEVLPDLPPFSHTVHTVSSELSPELIAMLDDIYDDVKAELDSKVLPDFTRMSKVRSLLAQAKVGDMLDIIEQHEDNDTPLVVFSVHKKPLEFAATREGWALITGSLKVAERQAIVERFQAGELKGLALTIGAGSVGITLTHAAHMLFVDLDWTPALNHQAECRIRRIGQAANHLSYTRMVVQHALDARVEELLAWKTELFRQTIDNVTDEYKTPASGEKAPDPRLMGLSGIEYSTAGTPQLLHESPAEQRERATRVAQEKAKHMASNFFAQATKASAGMSAEKRAEAEFMSKQRRAKASVIGWLIPLRRNTPHFISNMQHDRALLSDAMGALLAQCDGAQQRDDLGFNAVDSAVARLLVTVDFATDDLAAECAARMLYKYRVQLSALGFADAYEELNHE